MGPYQGRASTSCGATAAGSGVRVAAQQILAITLSFLVAGPAFAESDVSSGAAAARRLRPRGPSREAQGTTPSAPLAPLALAQRDEGHLVVMEHDGSDYSKDLPDGTPNYDPRTAVARRFYETHGDNYDFIVVFTNFEFATGNAQAFHNQVRNDVSGIGRDPLDVGDWFGSPGRLKAYIDMAALDRYRRAPWSLTPGDPGYFWTLSTLAHEVGHQWLSFTHYQGGLGAPGDLLGLDGAHWSYLLDSDASHMYGSDWQREADGRWRAARIRDAFSSLDLYLMGLVAPDKVAPFTLLRNPAVEPKQVPRENDVIGAQPEAVAVGQVVAAEGPRLPGHLAAPKEFRLAFVYLTAPGTEATGQELATVDAIRQAFAGFFLAQTRGVAVADTDLAEAPAPPPRPAVDLDAALAWLLGAQGPDGSWSDSVHTAERDTAAALVALAAAGQGGVPYQNGRVWLQADIPSNVDSAARRVLGLASAPLTAPQRAALANALLAQRGLDGGFGPARGYPSDPLDTALALRALRALDRPADAVILSALATLAGHRHSSGGWPMAPGGDVSTVVTAEVLLALFDWKDVPQAQALIPGGLVSLESRRNPDGGFGESPSTPYATAIALATLARAGSPEAGLAGPLGWLQSHQRDDGSWGGSRYETALVLGSLRGGIRPNLVVPADTLVLTPPRAEEGETVQVSFVVRNTGRGLAGASTVRLFDGPPDLGRVVTEATLGPLVPGEEVALTLDFPTLDRAGARTLYVVSDALGVVDESREDDNAASRALFVNGALPDLEVNPAGIAVTPYPPAAGETVEVVVTVTNLGEKANEPSLVRIVRGDPRSGGQVLGDLVVPSIAPGTSLPLALAWDTTGLVGTTTLTAFADPGFLLPESDETNNEAAVPVEIVPEAPATADLEVVAVVPVPSPFTRIPQTVSVRALVRNRGRADVTATFALYDTDPPASPAAAPQAVFLARRSSTTLTFEYTVTGPGNRGLVVVADPEDEVAEDNEDNNEARAILVDSQSTSDLEVPPGEVTPSAVEMTVGDLLSVTATVYNRGTTSVSAVPVTLVHAGPGGPVELTRALVSLLPGESVVARLDWTTGLTGDPLPLVVKADPFGVLTEFDETNNDVPLSVTVHPSTLTNLETNGSLYSILPNPPFQGASAQLTLRVKNTSGVDASSFDVQFWRGDPGDGGTQIGTVAVPGLAAGTATDVSLSWPSVDLRNVVGLFAFVDTEDAVLEYDEGDNEAFLPVSAIGYSDLVATTGDLALEPAFPRAGQSVEVRAVVRNFGQRPAPASRLRATEGEPGSLVAEVPVPPLGPGESATVAFTWTPAAAGEPLFAVQVDPANEIPESDEGNNLARRMVVVQDAELYLTAPYFSPDGDGTRDDTTIAWRAGGPVKVVLSNSRGKKVRTLVEEAPAEGQATWDGRSDAGRILPDGVYTFTVQALSGSVLGRARASLDTNRIPIHEAAGTRKIATQNLTCALEAADGPAFMPSEEEALFIVRSSTDPRIPVGLLRVSVDGVATWLFEDAWYSAAQLPNPAAVSPDGRELLVVRNSDLYAVDLQTGERRLVTSSFYYYDQLSWSPDGTMIALPNQVLQRDGSIVGYLPQWGSWAWSPDGRSLAYGNRIVSPDGNDERTIEVPYEIDWVSHTAWLDDGRIFAVVNSGGEGGDAARKVSPARAATPGIPTPQSTPFPGDCDNGCAFLLDPETEEIRDLSWLVERFSYQSFPQWSPVGDRVLYSRYKPSFEEWIAEVAREDGSVPLQLFRQQAQASPRSKLAWLWSYQGLPGSACLGSNEADFFVIRSLENLSGTFLAARLPGNNGLLLRGTASDRHLESWQLEYSRTGEAEVWRPIGPAFDVPVLNDTFGAWAPERPGTYALRLTVKDRAGNKRSRVRLVTWDRVPAIANVSQTEFLISPNADAVKDEVRFTYLVQEPTRLEVAIRGPLDDDPEAPPPPTVRSFGFDHPDLGPQAFNWDGRDEGGQVVPDGRYTVELNGMPFRVDVDSTPPDIALGWANVRTEAAEFRGEVFGTLLADRQWHVVDANLKSWRADLVPEQPALLGEDQIFEPERDVDGEVIYDEGLPRIKRVAGRAADTVQPEGNITELGVHGGATFTAVDHAGNVSVAPVTPVAEKVYLLHGVDYVSFLDEPDDSRGPASRPLMLPPIAERDASGNEVVNTLIPFTDFDLVETLRGTGKEGERYRFEAQPRIGGTWLTGPLTHSSPRVDFGALGLSFGEVYRGRFSCDAQNGRFSSESFLFRPCEDYMRLAPENGPEPEQFTFRVASSSVDPLVAGRLSLMGPNGPARRADGSPLANLPMEVEDGDLLRVFAEDEIASPFCVAVVTAYGESERKYEDDGKCRNLVWNNPNGPPECARFGGGSFSARRDEALCGNPDVLRMTLVESLIGRTLQVVGDPDGAAFPIVTIEGRGTGFFPAVHPILVDVRELPDADLTVRVSVDPKDGQPDVPEQRFTFHVDRTPPVGEVLAPPEGAVLCVSPDSNGRETVKFVVRAVDAAPRLKVTAEMRHEEGPWVPVAIRCTTPDCKEPDVIRSNAITELPLDVTGLPSGDYTARFTFCDGAGNKSSVDRKVTLNREAPYLRMVGLDRNIFSPNGDGKAEAVAATFRLVQAVAVTAAVRVANQEGAIIRTLFSGVTLPAGNHAVAWDGRVAGGSVADGTYWIEVSGLDPCGRTGRVGIAVEVDNTPPDVEIARPQGGAFVLGSTDVEGVAWDLHFADWTLEMSPSGGAREPIGGRGSPVGRPGAPSRLGRWDTPEETGPYQLWLTARDLAENERTTNVTVQVVPRSRLESLAADPDLFSPNGDGRRETTTIRYVLTNPGRVTLEIRAADNSVVRRLEDQADQPAGPHEHPWDGRTGTGTEAPEGAHRVHIQVVDPFGLAPPEEAEVAVEIDRIPPALELGPPEPDAFVPREAAVRGAALDRNIVEWTLNATPDGGAAVELARGNQDQAPASLATLSLLGEGPHVLRLAAADRAENQSERGRPVVVDSIPPVVVLHDPAPASVWPKSAPIDVTGTVTDLNLLSWTLSVGPGPNPSWFTSVRTDAVGGEGIPVGPWDPSGVPDGDYTLRLQGEDKAGHREEARVTLAVDGTPPVALIDLPEEGGYVKEPTMVVGSATDLHLADWTLEFAPGDAATAFQWSPIGSGETEVENGPLAEWSPLPPDGIYTLRLTVRDRVGLRSVALSTVTVDTTPPAPPRPTGKAVRNSATTANVLVTWPPNTEPDLAGYRVRRGGEELRGLDPNPSYPDPDRPDGVYTYDVVAEDLAGNVSAPGTAKVTVDLTPPLAEIQFPQEGASVSGSVDILGTAWSLEDFAEYRLSVGAGASPTSFTLIRRSTLSVLGGTLGTWSALGEGPHVIVLEAEDTYENVARVTRNVVVDNVPPGPPVLVSVLPGPAIDMLVSTWTPPLDFDVIGYLLYRGGNLVNADGVVLGDLRPYLLPGLTHPDPTLPDGRHCYVVVAMDEAGNLSLPSNEICATLDNRPPHATIVQPINGLRFEFPIDVVAVTPDLDVVGVQFQMKPSAASTWEDLGAEDTQEPWQVVLDPQPLTFGPYDLQAVARDATRVDPQPTPVMVIYGDTTRPAPPIGLTARVDARDVTLTWNTSPEPDVDGYRLYRDGDLVNGTLIPAPPYVDERDPGTYRYTVTAVDGDGNESDPSEPADAVVYALRLAQPFPVTLKSTATLSGFGARPETTVEAFEAGSVVGSTDATDDLFEIPDVAVDLGGNFITARGRDALDNRSIPSNELVLIGNEAPGAVIGLAAAPAADEVALSWDPAPEADVVGYAVRRDGEALTGSEAQTQGTPSSTSPHFSSFYGVHSAPQAFDGNPNTVWVPIYYTADEHVWSLVFPQPVLVEAIRLRFAYYYGSPGPVDGYRVEALWEGRYVPLVANDPNPFAEVQHVFPTAFTTTELRVVIRTNWYVGIAEVQVTKSVLATTPAFTDAAGLRDGDHLWEVAAVDGLGAYGPWASVTAAVDRLSRPTGLVGVADGSDAVLTWNPNPEPQVTGYRVFRDGEEIGTAPATPSPTYRDPDLPNATYVYTVTAFTADGDESEHSDPASVTIAVLPPVAPILSATATDLAEIELAWQHPGAPTYALYRATVSGGPYTLLTRTAASTYLDGDVTLRTTYFYVVVAEDAVGNPSPTSNEASATPDRTRPLAAPVILYPTDAAHPITLDGATTPVRGRGELGTRVTLEVNGIPSGAADTVDEFEAHGSVELPENSLNFAIARDGRRVAFSQYDDETGNSGLAVRELAGGGTRAIPVGAYTSLVPLAFAADGRRLLVSAGGVLEDGEYHQDLVVVDAASGATQPVEVGPAYSSTGDWSPDGSRVAYPDSAQCGVHVAELATGANTFWPTSPCPSNVRWSPIGDRIAFQGWSGSRYELRLLSLANGATSFVDADVLSTPDWSPSGTHLLYQLGFYPSRIRLTEVATGTRRDLTNGSFHAESPLFDREGVWVSYRSYQAFTITVQNLETGDAVDASPYTDTHAWLPGSYLAVMEAGAFFTVRATFAGSFEVPDVALSLGENLVVARALHEASGLVSPDSEPVSITVPPSTLADLEVTEADLQSVPPVPRTGETAFVVAHVHNRGGRTVSEAAVRIRVADSNGAVPVDRTITLPSLPSGGSVPVVVLWTPAAAGAYRALVEADPLAAITESREDNNVAARLLTVQSAAGLALSISADRTVYPAQAPAVVTMRVLNGGLPFSGTARVAVETATGGEVALLDVRPLALAYGSQVEWELPWNTGSTYAGDYAFRLRLTDATGAPLPSAEHAFRISPDVRLAARLTPDAASVPAGSTAGFLGAIDSLSLNAPLAGVVARLVIRPEAGGASVFEAESPLGLLLPGASADVAFAWPSAAPAGRYVAELHAVHGGASRATAAAPFEVTGAPRVVGAVVAVPDHVLVGDPFEARFEVTNLGPSALAALPVHLEVVSGAAATVHLAEHLTIDFGPGEARPGAFTFPTGTLVPGPYLVRLRAGDPATTLARASVRVHGLITPPSIHSPADGATVDTPQPVLTVNNATSSEGAALRYEYQLYLDAGLRNALPGVTGIPETTDRTSWRIPTALGEDQVYWWRARATDGFSTSGWSPVASFRFDAVNLPPTSPVPDSPAPNARVASRQPPLVARNADDPERDVLTYEFRLAADADMQQVLASAAGVAEGNGLTTWPLPILLDEDTTYCWAARASDARAFSPWSVPACFLVDTEDLPPTAPVLLRPVDGVGVSTITPDLVVGPARDPEGSPLHYLFELDRAADFSSAERQASPPVPEAGPETAWTPPSPLQDNTLYHWRASASDGRLQGPWARTTFFVNLGNNPPTAPVPQSPVGGEAVPTLTPDLVVRNATDPDGDALSYEFTLADLAGAVVAEVSGVPESPAQTGWTTPELADNGAYQWRARAFDGMLRGEWSPWETFRVKAAPGAPSLVSPPEGAVVETRRPELVVRNATSPRGRTLTYTFELYSEPPGLPPVLVDRIEGVAEGPVTTSWTAPVDLADGPYFWRSRAFDGQLYGPWMDTARFSVATDEPPAPPTGLTAVPGDARVDLTWNASPEPDVIGYRLYRSLTAGGPYTAIADTTVPSYPDTGLTNGVTYYYVVTARDNRFESGYSNEAAATPQAPTGDLEAEVRFDPDTVQGECLLTQACGQCHDDHDDDHHDDDHWRHREAPGPEAQHGSGGGGPKPVRPILECVADNLDGTYTALYGYDNENTWALTIPVGSNNRFSPSPKDRGQPTDFPPGRTAFEEAFPVDFSGGTLTWTLKGRTAKASSSSSRCSAPTPEVSCPEWLKATIELPPGHDPKQIDLESVRLAGTVAADDDWWQTTDVDSDGRFELRVRFRFQEVAPLLAPGPNTLAVTGRVHGVAFRGQAVVTVSEPRLGLFVSPRTLHRASQGQDVLAQLRVPQCLDEDDVDVSSLRLNGTVPVKRVVSSSLDKLIVKFDRAAVLGVLPNGDRVEVWVSGTVSGQPFTARDFIRVTE